MLFNLLGNASKFTLAGSVTIKVMFEDDTSTMAIDIIDTGIGMKAEDLQKLFKFFGKIQQSSDINRGGMGLGLTISKMIIGQLKGDINVTSEPGQGSKFSFSFPVECNDSLSSSSSSSIGSNESSHSSVSAASERSDHLQEQGQQITA